MNINDARQDFPFLQYADEQKLVYLDSAATSQKPQIVLDAVNHYYTRENANARRGISKMSFRAEQLLEQSRAEVARFISAGSANEIIFTKNATEALNLATFGYGLNHLKREDEILISILEHHSNLVPWQIMAQKVGAKIKYVDVTSGGEIDLIDFETKLSKKTKIVAVSHLSNVSGAKSKLDQIIKSTHRVGAVVVIDGAQAVAHLPVNVSEFDADFYAFSGHKMYAPNGVGVLYGKSELLSQMSPVQFGGGMIESVGKDQSTFARPPHCFEAGTGDIAAVVGFKSAIDYINSVGFDQIMVHEKILMDYAKKRLQTINRVEILAPKSAKDHFGAISFNVSDIHPHDVAEVMDAAGIVVRAGHHCAMPLMQFLNITSTVRISLGLYNNLADVDRAVEAIEIAMRRF